MSSTQRSPPPPWSESTMWSTRTGRSLFTAGTSQALRLPWTNGVVYCAARRTLGPGPSRQFAGASPIAATSPRHRGPQKWFDEVLEHSSRPRALTSGSVLELVEKRHPSASSRRHRFLLRRTAGTQPPGTDPHSADHRHTRDRRVRHAGARLERGDAGA